MSTDLPPQDEDPVRVTTAIRWSDATGIIAIPEILAYSTGVYFAVHYETLEPRPPARPQTQQELRQVADEATRLTRIRLRLAHQMTVNGTRVRLTRGESTEPGFTAWFWSPYPADSAGQPASGSHIQLNWEEVPGSAVTVPFPPPGTPTTPADTIPGLERIVRTYVPPQGEHPVVVQPGISWHIPQATITIPDAYFYSTGVYLPVTYRFLVPFTPAPAGEADWQAFAGTDLGLLLERLIRVNGNPANRKHGQSRNGVDYTAWFWIDADEAEAPLRVQLNWAEDPGQDATIEYPPPGSPATPSPHVPEGFTDRGNNWSSSSVKLTNIRR